MNIERITLHDLQSLGIVANGARKSHALPSFGAPAEPAAPPPLTEADIRAAQEEGYRKGFLEGEREGQLAAQTEQAKVAQELRDSLTGMARHIEQLIQNYNMFVANAKAMLPPLALTLARKVAGDALQENALASIEQTIGSCLETMLGEAQIHVLVNSRVASALEEKLTSMFAHRQDPGEITITGDDAVPIGDCRLIWKQGHAERSTAQLWSEMENLIAGMVDSAHREPPALPLNPETSHS